MQQYFNFLSNYWKLNNTNYLIFQCVILKIIIKLKIITIILETNLCCKILQITYLKLNSTIIIRKIKLH